MIEYDELMSGYIGASDRLRPKQEYSEEAIEVIYQNAWLRILVATDCSLSDRLFIVVEICIPRSDEKRGCQDHSDEHSLLVLRGMIEHLHYLNRLASAGFSLQIIREDCLWTATKFLPINPKPEDFKVLVPPECPLD